MDRLAVLTALSLASIAVHLLPFHLLARTASWGAADKQVGRREIELSREFARSISSISQRVPWRTVCLQKGLALQWLLRIRGVPSILHFGIGPGSDQLSAHVWVSLGGTILIGEEEAGNHAQVAIFPASL